jgi:hypothetical protein
MHGTEGWYFGNFIPIGIIKSKESKKKKVGGLPNHSA